MKKTLIVLSVIILTIFNICLCFSYGVRDDCIDFVSKTLVKNEFSDKILNSLSDTFPNLSYEQLAVIEKKIDKNENVRAITAKYFDKIMYSVVNNTDINEPNTKSQIEEIVNKSLDEVSKQGISITNDQRQTVINTVVESNVINKVYINASKNLKSNLTNNEQNLVLLYNTVTSTRFRTIMMFLILIFVVAIAALKKSVYKWLVDFGVSCVLTFLILFFMIKPFLATESANYTSKIIGKTAVINMNNISKISFVACAVGVFAIILYFIIMIAKREKTPRIRAH